MRRSSCCRTWNRDSDPSLRSVLCPSPATSRSPASLATSAPVTWSVLPLLSSGIRSSTDERAIRIRSAATEGLQGEREGEREREGDQAALITDVRLISRDSLPLQDFCQLVESEQMICRFLRASEVPCSCPLAAGRLRAKRFSIPVPSLPPLLQLFANVSLASCLSTRASSVLLQRPFWAKWYWLDGDTNQVVGCVSADLVFTR